MEKGHVIAIQTSDVRFQTTISKKNVIMLSINNIYNNKWLVWAICQQTVLT